MDPTGGEDGDPEPGGMGSGGEEQNGTRPQGAPPVYNAYEGPEISSSYNDDQENRVIGGDEIAGSGAGHMWAGSEGEGITGPGGPGDEKDLNSFFTRLWNKLTGQSNPVPQAAPINIMPNYKGPSVAAPINIIPNYNGPSGNDIEGPNYEFEVMGSRDTDNWLRNVATAMGMTTMWATGIRYNAQYVYTNNEVANAMRNSPGIVNARNNYYSSGKTFGNYNFGLPGLICAGIDPIEQFIGSYSYTITTDERNLTFTIKNTTSFSSAAYHITPYSWNWNSGPMSDYMQIYTFTEPIR